MPARFAPLVSIALAGSLLTAPAFAATYDLVPFPFSFQGGATSTTASLTTDFVGSLTDEAAIEAVLNSASYSAVLYGAGGALTRLDKSNSRWDLSFSFGSVPMALLDVRDTGISLSFSTLQEFTGATLLLRSFDGLSVLQYRQDNNVSNSNFVDFGFNAISHAAYAMPYGSTFSLPVAAIPEPEVLGSLTLGLFLIGWATRKRRRDT